MIMKFDVFQAGSFWRELRNESSNVLTFDEWVGGWEGGFLKSIF
jgi:hypothetical protein